MGYMNDNLEKDLEVLGEIEEIGFDYQDGKDFYAFKIQRKQDPKVSDYEALKILNAIYVQHLSSYPFVNRMMMDENVIDVELYRI